MQLTRKSASRYDRLHHIETGYDTKPDGRRVDDAELELLLRRAHRVRDNDPIEFKQIANRIFEIESWAVRQMVSAAGFNKSGSNWVDEAAIDDVVNDSFIRMLDFLKKMKGESIGEWRNGVRRCIHWAVVDYIRDDQRNKAEPIDHGHFTDALAPEDLKYTEIASLAATGQAEDRALIKEKLAGVTELEPRAAEVIKLRLIEGYSSKEVAEMLGTTPANVDQIVSRSTRKLAGLFK